MVKVIIKTEKQCSCCKETLPIESFHRRKQFKDGRNSWCRACHKKKRPHTITKGTPKCPKTKYFTAKQMGRLLSNAARRANIRSLDYELTALKLYPLLLDFCENNYHVWEPYHPFRPSIDKIDPARGYNMDNIQIIWAIENHCKNIYTNEDVLKFCELKIKKHKSRNK